MGIPVIPLTILAGIGFVLLGRWLYKDPRRVGSTFLNPNHPAVQKLVRVQATLCILAGTGASVGLVLALLLRGVPGIPLLVFAVAIAGAWFLRPKVTRSEAEIEAQADDAEKPRLLGRHWKMKLVVAASLMAILMIVLIENFNHSDIVKMAFASVEASPLVKQRLGEPIKRGFFSSGHIEIDGASGHADVAIPVSGPKGKATIYAVAQKSIGVWKFETLEVAFGETGPKVSLLTEAVPSSKP